MKKTMMHKAKAAALVVGAALALGSCHKKFDASSYAPAFEIGGFTSSTAIAANNLVAYWSFDDNLNETVSGTASTNAGATSARAFRGNGLNLVGASKSYVTAPASAAITGLRSFTISFWVNPTFVDVNNDNSIDGILGLVNLSNTTGFWGNLDWFVENGSTASTAKMRVHVQNGAVETWISMDNVNGFFGTWSNHTLTYDAAASSFAYYINGARVNTTPASWTGNLGFTNSGPLVFGAVHFQTIPSLTSGSGNQTWASYLTGVMDEIRVYNRALTTTEVEALVVLQGKGK